MPSSGSVTMNGGTFSSGATAGFSQTLGTLSLTDNSTIALGTGNHSLSFAASNGQTWTTGKVLTITGWAGASYSTGTTSGTAGKIFVGSSASGLTAVQLSQIKFFDGTNYYAAAILSSGEIVPCLRFAITSISPASPSAGNTFSVTVQTQDYSGTARNAVNATGFTLSTNGNAGAISGTTTGTVAAGSNSFTISNAVVLAQGGTLVTITATRTSGDNTATGTSATFTVTCTPPSFTTNPATGAQSVCNGVGTFPTLTVAASGTSGYQWYSNASNNNTTGTIIGGATSASYTPDNTLVGTTYYYCVASSGTCTGTSNVSGGMTVNNPPSITTHPATGSQTICSGGTLSPSSLSVVANNAIRYPLELH